MIYKLLLIPLIVIFLIGCDEKIDPKDFPVILTLNPIDIDSTGATFRGKLIVEGLNKTSSYGFIWSIDENIASDTHKITLGSEISAGIFICRVNYFLSSGFRYKIQAFATYDDHTVYGNPIKMESRGGEKSPWAKVTTGKYISDLIVNKSGYSDNNYGYIIFGRDVYCYDPAKDMFSLIYRIPGYTYSSVNLNKSRFFFDSDKSGNVYKLENGTWSNQTHAPFSYYNYHYYYVYTVLGNILILSSIESYSYEPSSDTWQVKTKVPSIPSVAGTDVGGYAFVMTKDKKIFKYYPEDDKWEYITSYPDDLKGIILAFSYENKIYFGFSHSNSFWAFDLTTKTWKETEPFPSSLNPQDFFYFFLRGKFYIGQGTTFFVHRPFDLYSFDPSKFK